MRLRFEPYGCALNRGQAAELAGAARALGHSTGAAERDADLLVLVTCTVVQATEDRMLGRLVALRERGRRVLVAGCMAGIQAGRVRRAHPGALLLPPQEYADFPDLLRRLGPERAPTGDGGGAAGPAPPRRTVAVGEVPVADGCRGRCTFCITRLARGPLRSRPVDGVAARVRALVGRGCVEVRLSAQDLGAYGRDIGTDLPALLWRLCDLEGDFRLRAGMMNPESLGPVLDGVMEALGHPRMFRFLHVPVQSGDDAVLEAMGRGHSAGDFERVAGRFREVFPKSVLATDIIVGFPGEDATAFRNTLDLLDRTRPDIVNIKAFSPRPGTPAFHLKGAPGRAEVRRRIAALQHLRRRVSLDNNRRLLGTVQQVLVTERARKGGVMGRTDGYLPVLIGNGVPLGSRLPVTITGAGAGFLAGSCGPIVDIQH